MDAGVACVTRVVVTMPVGPHVHQPHGILHGGASMVLAETAASVGAGLNCPPGMRAVGQEINGNHLRAKRDGLLRATAEPVHIGRTSQVWTVDIRDEAVVARRYVEHDRSTREA